MTDEAKQAIWKFATSKLMYSDCDCKTNLEIFQAFNVEKLPKSSNSGDYAYSALATLGDSVATLLLCQMFYNKMKKGEISDLKKNLSNAVFYKIAEDLNLLDLRYDQERFGLQKAECQFTSDSSAMFEAVLGAVYIDLGIERTKLLWNNLFYPLIDKHKNNT